MDRLFASMKAPRGGAGHACGSARRLSRREEFTRRTPGKTGGDLNQRVDCAHGSFLPLKKNGAAQGSVSIKSSAGAKDADNYVRIDSKNQGQICWRDDQLSSHQATCPCKLVTSPRSQSCRSARRPRRPRPYTCRSASRWEALRMPSAGQRRGFRRSHRWRPLYSFRLLYQPQ